MKTLLLVAPLALTLSQSAPAQTLGAHHFSEPVTAPAFDAFPSSQSATEPIMDADSTCSERRDNVNAVRAGVGGAFVAGNAYLWHYFKKAWWSGEKAPHLFFHSDWDLDFRDQDKFGHMFGGYHLTRVGHDALKYACVSEKKAQIISAAYALFFQTQIEVFDGHYKKYGFSYADEIANTTGMVLAVAQERHPWLRAIKPTMSYAKTAALKNNKRYATELRPSLDYSGQTYWFSTDVNALLPDDKKQYWPAAVRLSVGHSITDWVSPIDGHELRAKRKLLLSIDLDPEKLPGSNHFWMQVKHQLSYYHFPAPAIQFTPSMKGIAWYR